MRMRFALGTLLLVLHGLNVNSSDIFTGHATTYGLSTAIGGSCSIRIAPYDVDETLFVAMNRQQYDDSAACSRCISITGPQGTVTAYVADYCYECGENNLDLNTVLWNTVIGGDPRVESITWSFTACPDEKEKFCMKEGSNPNWFALQVDNSRDGIKSMEINGKEATVIGITSFYQVSPSTALDMENVEIKITSNTGITSSFTLQSSDYNDCPMPSDSNTDTSTATPSPSVTTTTTTTIDVTGAVAHHMAWQSYRRRRAKVY